MEDLDFSRKIAELQRQVDNVDKNKSYQQSVSTIADVITKEISTLKDSEVAILADMQEYKEADLFYRNCFNNFIMEKFKHDFINSDIGKRASNYLLETIKKCKSEIVEIAKQEQSEYEEFKKWKQLNKQENGYENTKKTGRPRKEV